MLARRRLGITLRVLMVLVLILGVWLGLLVNQARERREAVAAVKAFGGWVHYDDEFVKGNVNVPRGNDLWSPAWGKLVPGKAPWAPAWLRRAIGDEYFREIAHVSLFVDIAKGEAHAAPWNIGRADDVLVKLEGRAGIKTLQIGGQQATDRGMESIGAMTGLEELIVWPAHGVTDAGIAHLRGLKNVKNVFIGDSGMTDEGLRSLGALPAVEHLKLPGHDFSDKGLAYLKGATHLKTLLVGSDRNEITDAGMASLGGLKDLERLDISGSKVTDRGLEQLKRLTKLEEIGVDGTPITAEGRERFRAAMPLMKMARPR